MNDELAGTASNVVFRDLSMEETEALLLRNKVGRLAFAFHDRVDIQPIHYVYERGWIYGRTSMGEKIATLEHNRWVAFEVDEVEASLIGRAWSCTGVSGSCLHEEVPTRRSCGHGAADLVSQIVRAGSRNAIPLRSDTCCLESLSAMRGAGRQGQNRLNETTRNGDYSAPETGEKFFMRLETA